MDFDIIVSATGSGGTYAGLTLGAKLFLPGTVSVGIGVCDDPFESISLDLMRETAALLEADVPVDPADVHIPYHIGSRAPCPNRGHPGGPRVYRQGPGRVLPAPGGGRRLPGRRKHPLPPHRRRGSALRGVRPQEL